MPWCEVSVSVVREHSALAECVLEQQGALAITLEDDADHPVLEPGPGETPLWPTVHVRGLFGADADREKITEALQAVSSVNRPQLIRWGELGDQEWERAWMERFQPMKFGRSLWIVPTGMQIPFDPRNTEIRLDPGLAFGTGSHPTTALCLEWLDCQDVTGRRIVDYGCGSGILGIAAALKGATRVVCVDNDPQALQATAANAVRNGVADIIECRPPEDYFESAADIVLANILAGPLIELCPLLTSSLKNPGWIVLSGILQEQCEAVVRVYSQACTEVKSDFLDGWARLVATKAQLK